MSRASTAWGRGWHDRGVGPPPNAARLTDLAGAPTELGRYRILRKRGSGGMASVYLGKAQGIGGFERDVAVKVLHPHLAEQQEMVDDFLREARIAARVRHPNVVPVLDVG